MATKQLSTARKILDQYASLPARERLLALVAFIGFAYLVCDLTWYRPQQAQAKALDAQVSTLKAEADGLTRAIQTVSAELPQEATAPQRAERDRLKVQVQQAEAVIQQAQNSVRVGEVIRTLAAQNPSVTVALLRTLPTTVFFNAAASQAAAAAATPASGAASAPGASSQPKPEAAALNIPNIYRHGVEVTLRGPYPALASYMQALEQGTTGVYWGPVRLDSAQYPESTLRATMYIISVQPDLTFD